MRASSPNRSAALRAASWLAAMAAVLLVSACRFAPDLAAWPSCLAQSCPDGYRCLQEEWICVPECGEGAACEAPSTDAGGGDAATDAGTEPDGGALPDAGPDAGIDAGTDEDAGEPDAGALRFTTLSLPNAQVDEVYVQVLHAEGGSGTYRFAVVGGGLPAGLGLLQEGTLGGTPTVAGTSGLVIQVTDDGVPQQVAAAGFSLTVEPSSGTALTIETATLPSGQSGVEYAAALLAGGGTPPYQWSLSTGALPEGLALFADGRIAGTPTRSGETTLDLSVRDSSTPTPQTSLRGFTLRIVPAEGEALSIATTSLPGGSVGAYYLGQLGASGGTPPYVWSLASGSLPQGLTLSGGAISGTPLAAGSTAFGLQVSDNSQPAQSSSRTFTISVSAGEVEPLAIATSSLPDGRLGFAYSAALSTTGGTTPTAFALASGSLPPGLSLSAAGTIGGTPISAGTYGFEVVATDATSPTPQSAQRSFSLAVSNGGSTSSLTVSTSSLPDAVAGIAYSQQLAATGGSPPYSWELAAGSALPGLTLNGAGLLSGTPSEAGSIRFNVKVTDAAEPASTATRSLTLNVQPSGLRIDTAAQPAGTMNVAYRSQVTASGGTQPYAFRLLSGTLPQGLTLCQSSPGCVQPGEISGTPKSRGKSQFEVEVSDTSTPAQTTSRSFSIDIN